jgi:hypothetical protein
MTQDPNAVQGQNTMPQQQSQHTLVQRAQQQEAQQQAIQQLQGHNQLQKGKPTNLVPMRGKCSNSSSSAHASHYLRRMRLTTRVAKQGNQYRKAGVCDSSVSNVARPEGR